jgi:transposase
LQVEVPWSRSGSGFTLLFEAFIVELASIMTVNELSNIVGEHDTRLWRILKHHVNQAKSKEDYSDIKSIGIDETSNKKGHNYISLFVDLDESKILYATKGKDSSTIDSFVQYLKEHQGSPKSIENVCCDMSPAFIKGSKENFPNGKITFDKFHVMKKVNEAVDQVRRDEQSNNKHLKKTRYIWLKNPGNLTKKQRENLRSLSKMNLKTLKAYNMKLTLKAFWDITDTTTAASYLQKWYLWAIRSRLKPMIKTAHCIESHWAGIVQYIESRINNGILEGINSVIQTVKRKARGFRNVNNFITAIYLKCSKLEFNLPKALAT